MKCVINYSISSQRKRRAFFIAGLLFRTCRIISSRDAGTSPPPLIRFEYLCGICLARRRRLVPGVGVFAVSKYFLRPPEIFVFLPTQRLPFFRRIIPRKAVNAKMAVRYAVSITLPTPPCPENPTNCFPYVQRGKNCERIRGPRSSARSFHLKRATRRKKRRSTDKFSRENWRK